MTTEALVAQAAAGDVDAFSQLVTRYQGMAFAYALSTVRDYQLAEDATQQALITAYRNLGALQDARRFGGWLRGIVRFESLRILRERARHRADSLEADPSIEPVDPASDLEHQAAVAIDVQHALALLARLPGRQRVAAQLYYLGDQSQGMVAEFLGISVSSVNNRLREARAALRREGAMVVHIASMSTPDFAETIGRVIRSNGLTIDTRINGAARPPLLTAVQVGEQERAILAYVAQYLDDDVARLVVTDGAADEGGTVHGASVRSSGAATSFRASQGIIDRLVSANSVVTARDVITTGIKVIDLLAPLVQGGVVAVAGAMNVGKLVVVEELARRLTDAGQSVTLLVFLKSPDELGVAHQLDYRIDGRVAVVVVPVADASPEALATSLDRADTVLAMSRELGIARRYPAIDPVESRAITAATSPIATRARDLLRQPGDDARASMLRAYLTQPFFVAEPYTGRPGVSVDPGVAEADIALILNGEIRDLDPEALTMGASLADIRSAAGL